MAPIESRLARLYENEAAGREPCLPAPPPGLLTIARIAELGAQVRPDGIALVDGTAALTYRELDRSVREVVSGLLNRGVRKGDRVAVYLPNCSVYLVFVLAIARAGAVFVPVSRRFKVRDSRAILSAAKPKLVFTSAEGCRTIHDAVRGADLPVPLLVSADAADAPGCVDLAAFRSGPARPAPVVGEDDLFSLMFTSGTTGTPKGALGTHRARMLWILNAAQLYELGPDEVYLAALPFAHSAGLTFALMHLHAGATVHILEEFDPAGYLDRAHRIRATSALAVPAMLSMLVEKAEAGRGAGALAGLRRLVTCGSRLGAAARAKVLDRLTPRLYDYYGSTESSSMTVLLPQDQRRKPGSVGKAFPNVAIRVAGPDGAARPAHAVGEVWSRNPYGMTAYLDDPEATRAAFAEGWYRTGDLGYLDEEGYLHLVGRSTDVVISGGANIYPAEIEGVLLEHEAVADCAVTGEPDAVWGQLVAAFVVLRDGHSLDLTAVQAHCCRVLADYKKPRRLRIVPALPRNPAGKIVRADLLPRADDAAHGPTIGESECPCV